jgi:hypothetical protein
MNFRGCFTSTLVLIATLASTMSFAEDKTERLTLVPDWHKNLAPPPLIVPNYLAAQEYYEASHTFIDTARVQQVYGASEFRPGPILITGFHWRPTANLDYGFPFHAIVPDFQINLSTTSKQPDQLSSVFAENVGADEVLAFQGALKLRSSFRNAAGGTKKFDIFVHLQRPFYYDPAQGNLLLDCRNFQTSLATYVDMHGLNGDGGSRAVALDPNATTASFTDTGVDVIQVIFRRVKARN